MRLLDSPYLLVDIFRLACLGVALYMSVLIARVAVKRERRRRAGLVPDRYYVAWQTSAGMIGLLLVYAARRGSEVGRAPDFWTWASSSAVLLTAWGVLKRIQLARRGSARGRHREESGRDS